MNANEFDLYVARKYVGKEQNARQRGIEFSLTITSVKNILKAKRCYYTGVELTHPRQNKEMRGTDVTIERVDSSKGYVKGNVVAVCHAANQAKAYFETGSGCLEMKHALRLFTKVGKHVSRNK